MPATTDPQVALTKPPKPRSRKPVLMTNEEAQAAAVRAGFICVRADRIEGAAALGQYATELGPLKLSRAWYVMATSEVQNTMAQLDTALSRNPEPEVEGALLALKKGLIGDVLLAARGMADSCKIDTATPAPPEQLRPAGFGPNVQIVVGPQQPQLPPPAATDLEP